MDKEKIGTIVFLLYFVVWIITVVASVFNRKISKDIKKKIKIDNMIGIINAIALLIVGNILLYLWESPIIAKVIVNCVIFAFVGFSLKFYKHCPKCGIPYMHNKFNKYCTRCGSALEIKN